MRVCVSIFFDTQSIYTTLAGSEENKIVGEINITELPADPNKAKTTETRKEKLGKNRGWKIAKKQ